MESATIIAPPMTPAAASASLKTLRRVGSPTVADVMGPSRIRFPFGSDWRAASRDTPLALPAPAELRPK